ncbi:CNNM domain-containing protein [Alphaproteobacteria bacterium]|nr:CNNM domain-containing protein [Alphaproteobacteria bacterium]
MTLILLIKILAIIVLLFCSAVSSGSETSLTAISKIRALKYKEQGIKNANYILKIKEIKDQFITSVLLANNLFNILATALFTEILITYFGSIGISIATIIMTLLIVIFSEVTPKIYAINNPMKLSLMVSKFFYHYTNLIGPLVLIINKISLLVMKLIGMKLDGDQNKIMQEEFEGAIQYQKQYSKHNKVEIEYMNNLLDLKNLKVDQLMTHRNDIIFLNLALSLKEIKNQLNKNTFTRVPVINGNFDNVLGVLDIRDLFKFSISSKDYSKNDIRECLNKARYIPENKMATTQLIDFKLKREHSALVVNEYGEIKGLISFEDIIEEIIGEVFDETDEENSYLEKINDTNYLFNGNANIREVNRVLKIDLPDEFVTLSGLVHSINNEIPKVGKVLHYQEIKIQIISRSINKINKIKISI